MQWKLFATVATLTADRRFTRRLWSVLIQFKQCRQHNGQNGQDSSPQLVGKRPGFDHP
nr:hypothetical protein [Lactiplantibacillus plantarum]